MLNIRHRQLTQLTLLLAIVGVAFLTFGCGGDEDNPANGSPAASVNPSSDAIETPAGTIGEPEECTVSEDDIGLVSKLDFGDAEGGFEQGGQFGTGDEVRARMRLINCTGADSILYFDTTQRYEMKVLSEDSTEVFNSSAGVDFASTAGTQVLAPNETVVYEETWNQLDPSGTQVGPGIYRVSFLSVGCGSEGVVDCPGFGPGGSIEILE